MKLVIEDVSIKLSVLKKLPRNSTILAVYDDVSGMSGKKQRALKCLIPDLTVDRKAFFSIETGEYLGDDFSYDKDSYSKH